MRLLVVSPFVPCETAAHGGGAYLGSLVAALAERAAVDLVAFATAAELREGGRPELDEVRWVLRRTRAEMRGAAVHVDRFRHGARWMLGVPLLVSKFRSTAMASAVRELVACRRPDACLIEMGWMAQYLAACAPAATVLTDHEAGVPAARMLGRGADRDRRLWLRYVRRSYARADLVQALNAEDARALESIVGREVAVRPPAVPWPEPVEPARAPRRLVFLGDYLHPPNPEAAAFVAHEVFPRVRVRCPDAELWLAGPNAGADVAALGEAPGVRVVGRAADLRQLLGSARALVAPVFRGGGSRIKVLTAMAHGLPVVSNALGLRGVDAPVGAVVSAEDAESIAAGCTTWLEDPTAASRAGAVARAWAEQHASPRAAAAAQIDSIERLLAGR